MEPIIELFGTGTGPSSSHTIALRKAAENFPQNYPAGEQYRVVFYGNLAAAGKGHFTDKALLQVFPRNLKIIRKPDEYLPLHPNGMRFEAFDQVVNVMKETGHALPSLYREFSSGGLTQANRNKQIKNESNQ